MNLAYVKFIKGIVKPKMTILQSFTVCIDLFWIPLTFSVQTKTFFKTSFVFHRRRKYRFGKTRWWMNDGRMIILGELSLCNCALLSFISSNPVTGPSNISQITIIVNQKTWPVKLKWSWSIWGMCLAQAPELGAHSGLEWS